MREKKLALLRAAAYAGYEVTELQLELWVKDFANQTAEEIERAVCDYAKQTGRFPVPPSKALAQATDRDYGNEVASKIIRAVSLFGWPNPDEARAYVGPLGWQVVERFGGWLYLCQNLGGDIGLTTFTAQTRDLVESQLRIGKTLENRNPLTLGNTRATAELERSSDIMRRIVWGEGNDAE